MNWHCEEERERKREEGRGREAGGNGREMEKGTKKEGVSLKRAKLEERVKDVLAHLIRFEAGGFVTLLYFTLRPDDPQTRTVVLGVSTRRGRKER